MGFYHGLERFKKATDGVDPVLTPREYISAFVRAIEAVLAGDGENGAPPSRDGLVKALTCRVRRHPTDPTAHRLLGAALLDAGSTRAGVRHLGIALRLLLVDVDARESLHGALCAQLEIGLLLTPLMSIAARAGRPALLRRMLRLLP